MPREKCCKDFLRGRCKFGEKCRKTHRNESEVCAWFWRNNRCKFGDDCWKVHPVSDDSEGDSEENSEDSASEEGSESGSESEEDEEEEEGGSKKLNSVHNSDKMDEDSRECSTGNSESANRYVSIVQGNQL